MLHAKLVPAFAALCLLGLGLPAKAGSPDADPQVIRGLGPDGGYALYADPQGYAPPPRPRAGQYGGGLVEFLMTGNSTEGRTTPMAMQPRPLPRAYMASVGGAEQQDGAYGEPGYAQPAPTGPAGYEMPRKQLDPMFMRQEVSFEGRHAPGTIVIDTEAKFLYLVEGEGHAMRYGIGVGRPGFLWKGEKTITRKAEWPDWTPPAEMLKRRPDLPSHMEGGIANPLGARAMYLGSTLYRIHGTNEPDTIGTNVSSGCIRLTNDDVADLFTRVRVGTKVIVL